MEFALNAVMLMTPTDNVDSLFVGVFICGRGINKTMRKYIFIGVGGILGSILRYWLERVPIYHYHEHVPLNTLIINVTGSFILALVLTVAYEVWEFDADLRLGIATGLLGAYTTFSTLCKETVSLIRQGDYFSAISYVSVSTMLGLAAVYFGIVVARETVSELVRKRRERPEKESEEELEGGVE
jgi:CrcB protein